MAEEDDEMFMARSLDVTPKTTEQHLIARSDKSVAYVTNNKRLCSTFCTILKLTTDRHEASRGLFVTAELLVKPPLATARAASCNGLVYLFVCLSVCLSPKYKNAIFSKTLQFIDTFSIDE